MGNLRAGRAQLGSGVGAAAVLLLVVLAAIVLGGCQMQVGLDTKVQADGSGTFGFRFAVDKELLDLMSQQGASSDDLFGELQKSLPTDWKTEQGTDPNGTKWVTVSAAFKNPEDLKKVLAGAGSGTNIDLNSFTLTQKKGFFSTKTEYALKLDMSSALSNMGSLGGGLGQQLTPSIISSVLQFENRVTLPGSIKATNADKVEGSTAIWTPQLTGAVEMTATSESVRWGIVVIFIVIGVILIAIIVALIIVLMRRGRKPSGPAEAEGVVPVAPASPASPAAEAPAPPVAAAPAPQPAAEEAPAAPVASPFATPIPQPTTTAEPEMDTEPAPQGARAAVPAAAPPADEATAALAASPFSTPIPRPTTAAEPDAPVEESKPE
jgi:hypothetical protein